MNADVRRARIVGICGASGSGKSTLATTLVRRLPSASASVLSCDAHFKRRLGGLSSADTPHADLSAGEEPSIINWEGVRAEAEARAAECDLLIIEGHVLFAKEAENVIAMCDDLIFLDADRDYCADKRAARRYDAPAHLDAELSAHRRGNAAGVSRAEYVRRYEQFVWPAFETHVAGRVPAHATRLDVRLCVGRPDLLANLACKALGFAVCEPEANNESNSNETGEKNENETSETTEE